MDWEYYIDNDLSNSLVRGGGMYLMFRFWFKNKKKSDIVRSFVNTIENELWHPKNCYINMKTNTRIFYTIMMGTVGVTGIKSVYFYLKGKELEMNYEDYVAIGSLAGAFVGQISLGRVYVTYGALLGAFYGMFYCSAVKFFVGRQKRRAERIGITL